MTPTDSRTGPLDHQPAAPFPQTWCSQCGREFGPGWSGFSACKEHVKYSSCAEHPSSAVTRSGIGCNALLELMHEDTMRIETIGNATLYLGDCRDILPTLPKVDAVITDPPYGIGVCGNEGGVTSLKSGAKDYGKQEWDNEPIGAAEIALILPAAKTHVIWGGNYFAAHLPNSQGWLVWDKLNGEGFSLADVELAWTSRDKAARIFRMSRTAVFSEDKQHPTQKPIGLMEWCIKQAGDPQTVLDPYMGSGTTGVACMNLGRNFIGIEREPKYFDIACRRIEDAQRQGRLIA